MDGQSNELYKLLLKQLQVESVSYLSTFDVGWLVMAAVILDFDIDNQHVICYCNYNLKHNTDSLSGF